MNDTRFRAAGLLFIRALLGIIFFMQGWGKVFSWTIPKVYAMFFRDFEKTFLPKWSIWGTAYYTSWVELLGGMLLIIGLFRKYVLFFLAFDLLLVSFGHGLLETIWDLQHVFPRAILLILLMLLPQRWDRWNADRLLQRSNIKSLQSGTNID
jgi:uncharacterized membrane protein YphA (DoxX/SURF4 family)